MKVLLILLLSLIFIIVMEQVGLGTITVYRGSPNQRGHGIGTFLKGLFRASMPLLKRGASAVGKELMHSGINFLEDIENDMPAKLAFQHRLSQAQDNLKRKAIDTIFRGKGYKTKKMRKAIQSKRAVRKKRSSKKTSGKGKTSKTRKVKGKGKGKEKKGKKRTKKQTFDDIFG